MAVRIDLLVPQFTGIPGMTQYTVTNGSLHDIITEQLPSLTLQIEQNLAEFETGDILLSARNDDGWWDSTAFTSATLDPTARFPLCLYVNVFLSGALVFQGDIDINTISFDRKAQTVSFTCLGPLHRLEQWSAETVRRPTPTFSDFGLATSCGTSGSNSYLRDTTKAWRYDDGIINCCLIDSNNTIWTIIGFYGISVEGLHTGLLINNPIMPPPNWGGTPTTPPPVASYKIRPMVFATRYNLGSLGAVTSGAGYLNDAGASWTVNQWNGYYVYNWQGTAFGPITSNTGQRLNFASGTPDVTQSFYTIRKSNYPNLLESLGPTIEKLYITGQTSTVQGDLLHLTAANAIVFEEWGPTGTWVASTQEVAVQFAGPKASNPALSDHQLWLASAIEQDLYPSDGALMVTPYFRDKTVAQLVALLFAACGSAVQATAVNVPAFTDNIVRYADFAGKSVADALTELAMISNCTLLCKFSGTTAVQDAPKVTFNFQRRDAGLGTALELSAAGKILERSDSPIWDQYYSSIVVEGANSTRVQKGSTRPGANQLQVQSDFMDTYAWEHQVLDRLWTYFGSRRTKATIKVKAELVPAGTAGVGPVADDFEADTIGSMPTGWSEWTFGGSIFTVRQPNIGGNATKLVQASIVGGSPGYGDLKWDNGGSRETVDVKFDFYADDASGDGVLRFVIRGDSPWVNCIWFEIPFGPTYSFGAYPNLYAMVGGAGLPLVTDWHNQCPVGNWFTVRILAIGGTVQVKYWYTGSAEPGGWNLTTTVAPITTGYIGLYLLAGGGASPKCYVDNISVVGTPGATGFGLFSKVSLSGSDEWWVTSISRPLLEPAEAVDLSLISAIGTEYTPDDYALLDASALPEPPVVTGVTADGSNRDVALSWPFVGMQPLLGFQRTVWLATAARPETPMYVSIPYPVTVIAGTPVTFKDHILAGFLTSPGPWYVDYQTVLIDGRLSQPSPAYLFS